MHCKSGSALTLHGGNGGVHQIACIVDMPLLHLQQEHGPALLIWRNVIG